MVVSAAIAHTAGLLVDLPDAVVPAGRMVELPGRGSTFVTDSPGPGPDAPTVVLLHALACTGLLTWFPVIEPLRAHARVITLDQRWHGRGIRSAEFRLEDCADDVAALLDVLGIEDAVVAGYSMGSIIAQRVWRQHPDRVRGLVLAASTDRFQLTPYERLFFGALTTASAASRLLPLGTPSPQTETSPAADGSLEAWALAQFRQTTPAGVTRALTALGRHHSRPWLPEIDVPTSVVVMTRDKVIPTSRQVHLITRIPGAEPYVVAAGHAGCVLDAARFTPVFLRATADTIARG
ncbi:hypothetical protein GCM10022215_00730 [Nocardioides fonticola]|uniref:AB hydrolase-1 domain-containing protein n=1 Tax=Nocardioides fonticola TaxID=450363 RepID=A0ABP7X954_9ACTN